MNWDTALFFSSIIFTALLTAFLAWFANRHQRLPGVRAYALLALMESLLSLSEFLSMVSKTSELAQFWFNIRFAFTAFIPVIFLVFAVRYNGHGAWLFKRVIAFLCVIPVLTEFMVWSNPLHHLWVIQDVIFNRVGPLWIAVTGARIPGVWFMIHTFYSLAIMLVGTGVLFLTAWRNRRDLLGQSILLASGALVGLFVLITPIFNLLPDLKYNIFIPGIGLSAILYAIAILRFNFLKKPPAPETVTNPGSRPLKERSALAVFLFVFAVLVTGIASIAYFSYRSYATQLRSQVENQLEAVAKLKVNGLTDWREERMSDAVALSRSEPFASLVQEYLFDPGDLHTAEQLQVWLESMRDAYGYEHIYFLDVEGRRRLSSPDGMGTVPQHILEEMTQPLLSGEIEWLDFHLHDNESAHLSLLVPILADQDPNQPLGVVELDIDPEAWLYPYLQQWPIVSETAETLLVRVDGEDVLFLNPVRYDSGAPLSLRIPLSETGVLAVKGGLGTRGVVEGIDYRGKRVVGAIAEVPDSPWILVARMDRAEVYAPLRTRFWQIILLFGILLIATGTTMILIWRQNRLRSYREQVKFGEALRASEEKFRNAFLISPDGMAITRLNDGVIVSTNQGFEKMLGFSPGEPLGKPLSKIEIWEDERDHARIMTQLQETGPIQNFEVRWRKKNREIVYGLMSAAVIDIEGNPHLLTTTRDITDRKSMEMELLDRNKRLRILADILQHTFENTQQFLDHALEQAISLTNSQLGYIYFYNEEKQEFTLNTWSREVMKECSIQNPQVVYQLEKTGIWGEAVRQRKPIIVNDFQASHPLKKGYPEGHAPLKKFLTVPIFSDNQIVAVVGVANKAVDFNEVDVLQLTLLMDAVWKVVDQREATRELKESEERYRNLLDVAPVAIFVHTEGRVAFVNPAGVGLFGAESREQIIGKNLTDFIHPEYQAVVQERVQKLVAGSKGFYPVEEVFLRLDGTHINVEVMAIPLTFQEKPAMQVIVTDITKRKRTEEAILAREKEYKTLAENSPDLIARFDKQLRHIYVNAAAATAGVLTPEEFVGKTIAESGVPEPTSTIWEERIQKVFDTGELLDIEDEFPTPVGSQYFNTHLVPERSADGSVNSVLSLARNVTERKRTEKAIQEYSEKLEEMVEERTRELRGAQERLMRQERLAALGQLAGSIAHELRNPLGVISNATTFLAMIQPDAAPKVQEYIEIIQSETRTSEKIIADLLDFTRLQTVERQPADVTEMIKNSLTRNPAPLHIKTSLELSAGLPPCLVNASQIEQVLGNLLTNAYQAMPGGGDLFIGAEVTNEPAGSGEQVKVTVKDSGEGISAENMHKIFEPLFTTKVKGIGLGLAVSKKLIEANHGQIEVKSEPGKGSTFTILLPTIKELK